MCVCVCVCEVCFTAPSHLRRKHLVTFIRRSRHFHSPTLLHRQHPCSHDDCLEDDSETLQSCYVQARSRQRGMGTYPISSNQRRKCRLLTDQWLLHHFFLPEFSMYF